MAVQAQYPSNVLLLNRNMQESKTNDHYSLPPQPGGYLDQSSHILFNGANNTSNNSRKRARDISSSTVPMHSFSLQPQLQQTQLVDISQLHNNHQNVVSTGLRLSFGDQQLQQQQQQLHHQQQQSYSSTSSMLLSLLSEDVANQIKQQRDEIDQLLQAQGEQLRRTLAEKRQRHYRALLGAAEESVMRRLREKEEAVEKAARRNAELEARAAQLSVEAQVWQSKARAQEATAASLQTQLQHAIMSGGGAHLVEDGMTSSAAVRGGGEAEDAESGYIDPDRVVPIAVSGGPVCRSCRRRAAAVVLLPCRHLSVCTECDAVVQACPICLTMRGSSVEVFLS